VKQLKGWDGESYRDLQILGSEEVILIEKMRDAFLNGDLDIKVLSESLGRD